ncbi:MAG: c-type cytochrome [Acidimicrobiales bacterium]
MILATTQRALGLVLMTVVLLGFIVYVFVNLRRARPELGSEIELAPNKKPYFDDEGLEGHRLDRYLSVALLLLAVTAVGLPLYWLAEPGRQAGAVAEQQRIFAKRGGELYDANCSSCHGPGGVGGVRPHILTRPDGEFIAQVNWKAPALNNVLLKYTRKDVTWVLDHGRPFSPMQPWSVVGGGAMNAQQIQNIIDYLESVQLTVDEAKAEIQAGVDQALQNGAKSEGEALFNNPAAEGSYSCARCHTQGWSYDQPTEAGTGAYGPSLVGSGDKFADQEQYIKFISEGCVEGKVYRPAGECKSGQMPGFGQILTEDQIRAIVEYESSLTGNEPSPTVTAGAQ